MTRLIIKTLTLAIILFASTTLAQPANLAEISSKLPPLPRTEEAVEIPVDQENPAFRWNAIREGIEATALENGGITIKYTIEQGRAAGTALIIRKGSLEGIRALRISVVANRTLQVIPTLTTESGAAFAFPSLQLSKGRTVTVELPVDELAFFEPASRGDEPNSFVPADAMMISLVDISGFMGATSGDVELTIESMEGVL